jgi:hypothetical protein
MAPQGLLCLVIMYDYKLVINRIVKADGAIITPKALLPRVAAAIEKANTSKLEISVYDNNSVNFDT